VYNVYKNKEVDRADESSMSALQQMPDCRGKIQEELFYINKRRGIGVGNINSVVTDFS